MYSAPKITAILLACLLFSAGCVMRNSVEVSGGFFDSELQGKLPGADN